MAADKVLLVDDDGNLLSGLCRTLRNQPFALLTARNADEAIEVLKAHRIAVVVSDEKMPGRPGTEMLAWTAKYFPEVVRIVLTGNATSETAVRAVNEARAFRFFNKPVNPAELAMAIRDGIELHHAAVEPQLEPIEV